MPLPCAYELIPVSPEITSTGEKVWALIMDTPTGRLVTFWGQESLTQLRDVIASELGLGLTIADEQDLQRLRDAAPFEAP